ncbi:MAG: hypothetical protein FVQ82_11440 [Planctomycetes bacterium]|nr:hypothetical protein [Planctomycetota bacterium]
MIFDGIGVFFLVGGVAVGAILWDIQRDVNKYIRIAQKAHPSESDDAASLIEYVNSSKHTLKQKNHAVWTLGQIGDERAAAALKPYETGTKCYHADDLCQKVLKQAIRKCED